MRALLLLLCSLPLFASTLKEFGVTQRFILVTQDPAAPWKTLDYVCVRWQGTEVACGFVTKTSAETAVVDLEIRSQALAPGMEVHVSQNHFPCSADSVFTPAAHPKDPDLSDVFQRECTQEEKRSSGNFHLPAKYWIAFGTHWISPGLFSEFAMGDHWSLGASLHLLSLRDSLPSVRATSSGTAYGAHALFTFYGGDLFRGLYAQLGLGYLRGRLTLRSTLDDWNALSMLLIGGYRFLSWNGYGMGLSAGGYYLKCSGQNNAMPTYFFSPFVGIEFGVAF